MDSNVFCYRNLTPITSSTSSMTSSKACNIPLQEYRFCESEFSESVRNNRSDEKFLPANNTHVTNCSVTYGNAIMSVSSAGSVAPTTSNTGHCNVSNGNANCADVISVPIGTVQYHRRKFTLQEYQSRLYHNTAATDYRCREDIFSDSSINTLSVRGGTGATGRSSTQVPSLQLQGQLHQHYSNKVHHHQQSQHREQIAQQASTNHYNLSSTSASTAQDLQHHQKHNYACSPTLTTDLADDTLSCSLAVDICQMVAATQPHQNYNYEPAESQASLSMSSLQSQVPPLMYTVHRVVATSQIQTTGSNTFTSSSSVSSIVSAVRNETESIRNALTPVSATLSRLSFVGGGDISSCLGNSFPDESVNSTSIVASQAILHNTPPGFSSNVNYIASQTKEAKSVEVSQTESVTLGTSAHTSSGSFTNCVKATSSISRPLQNVIPACVYLISRVAVHMEIEGTAQCPSQVMLAAALGCEELGIANKLLAQSIFGLWMTSSLLEIQLKSYHRPYVVRVAWPKLLDKFSHGNLIEKKYDEPMITLKRSIFFSKHDEEKIKDHRILELLYEEAKHNVLTGRYIMESVHSLMLGGIQARIELGPFNSHTHTVRFLRENQSRFLPQHVAKNSSWSWLPVSRKNSAEVRLLEQFKRVPQTATTRKLMRKYLEFCWALPFYGAAFFHGQVEQPVHGLMSLVNQKDIEILVAVNERGLFVIDSAEYTLLLGLCYEDFSWDFAKPSTMNDPECLTCIFLQFDAIENGIQISKLMQIFSKQAPMIDALISHFAGKMKKRKLEENNLDQFHDEPNPIQNNGNGVLCNKLARLTLATFDEDGRCIGQMGSLSISY